MSPVQLAGLIKASKQDWFPLLSLFYLYLSQQEDVSSTAEEENETKGDVGVTDQGDKKYKKC